MNIGMIGFPQDQQVKLEKILSLSKHNRYALVAYDKRCLPDLLLVFGDGGPQAEELDALPRGYRSRLIQVSKAKPAEPGIAHIRYPLVSSRVIRTLDQMTHENEDLDAEELQVAAAQAEHRFSQYGEQAWQAAGANPEQGKTREHYRVLVVDDNRAMQRALGLELDKLPLPVKADYADSGEQALELIAASQYDFIFLDILMPGIDGFETCTRMRERAELKKTPIIMLTSKTSPLDEVKGIMAGCSTYLTKPIEHAEFQKVISRVSNWVDEFKKA